MEKVADGSWLSEGVEVQSEVDKPAILEEIDIEEIFVDGICGVY